MKFLPDIINNTSILDKINENSCENAEMKVMFLRKFTYKYYRIIFIITPASFPLSKKKK
ncbi:hypothetical protein BRYFOR_08583 [Marvinbryantia formatexigens DSM 14469]|uniref:Uncharacterized protein n=1 Tax=Marvinbryantia formatexigens DSM 14469 TaxID=478749 RepID=C6LIV3_9FIRM|nr:hypothetical protein BRYFOR_08583 [Marvinbryantia formatexigens DSM 14469]